MALSDFRDMDRVCRAGLGFQVTCFYNCGTLHNILPGRARVRIRISKYRVAGITFQLMNTIIFFKSKHHTML